MPQSSKTLTPSEIVYPELLLRCYVPSPPSCPTRLEAKFWPYRPPLTEEQVKQTLLGWETETAYATRLVAADKKIKPAQAVFHDAQKLLRMVTLGDDGKPTLSGEWVTCWNNKKNRRFRSEWALELAQDMLSGHWKLNCENIIVGRSGRIISGQHRLIAFVLACELWRLDEYWRQFWPEPPVLVTTAAFGCEEDQETVDTIDKTLARTDADNIFTSGLFDAWTIMEKRKDKEIERLLNAREKDEAARMLAAATDLLWNRVGAGSAHHEYKTDSELAAFRKRHPKLLACVKHLFDENQERAITAGCKMSAGQSAAVMYLMASGKSDAAAYRAAEPAPHEESLDLSLWDRAAAFWTAIAGGKLTAVNTAISRLADPDTPEPERVNRATEKFCILAKAWSIYSTGRTPTEKDVTLRYVVREDQTVLHEDDFQSFGGIDLGPRPVTADPDVSETEVEERKRKLTPDESAKVKAGLRMAQEEEAKRIAAQTRAASARKKG